MKYYHGRSNSRPFYGNHIYITQNPEYALRYSNDEYIYECELNSSLDKFFTIKNIDHLKIIEDNFGKEIVDKLKEDNEIDWSKLSYLSNDLFQEFEDFLKHFGFHGIILKEQSTYTSSMCWINQMYRLFGK